VAETRTKSRRGFAAMSPELRREIARKGGASVAAANRSFSKDRDLAASAGCKGGRNSRGGARRRQTAEQ
jgi:general stress protein YciG